jgi:hypothetical protein
MAPKTKSGSFSVASSCWNSTPSSSSSLSSLLSSSWLTPTIAGMVMLATASLSCVIVGSPSSPGKKCPTDLHVFLMHLVVIFLQASSIHDATSSLVGCRRVSFIIIQCSTFSRAYPLQGHLFPCPRYGHSRCVHQQQNNLQSLFIAKY